MKHKWEDFELTGEKCPLCGSPTKYTPYDVGHKEEECNVCKRSGDELFEFGRLIRKQSHSDLKEKLMKFKKFKAYIWFEKGDNDTGKTILDLVKEALVETEKGDGK
jgi:ribosome-binding protein aMBF1 (putative translation factor)